MRFFIFCALERFPGVPVPVLGVRRLITVGINRVKVHLNYLVGQAGWDLATKSHKLV